LDRVHSGANPNTMVTSQFTLPAWFVFGATFVFAVSGSLLAMRKGYGIVGTFALRVLAIRPYWRTRPLGPREGTQA